MGVGCGTFGRGNLGGNWPRLGAGDTARSRLHRASTPAIELGPKIHNGLGSLNSCLGCVELSVDRLVIGSRGRVYGCLVGRTRDPEAHDHHRCCGLARLGQLRLASRTRDRVYGSGALMPVGSWTSNAADPSWPKWTAHDARAVQPVQTTHLDPPPKKRKLRSLNLPLAHGDRAIGQSHFSSYMFVYLRPSTATTGR